MRKDTDVLIYATLFAVVFELFDVLHFKMVSWIILYHLACAIYIFLRMVRHAGFEVVDNQGRCPTRDPASGRACVGSRAGRDLCF